MAAPPDPDAWRRRVDTGLSLLLLIQAVTLFVALPLSERMIGGRILLDGCHVGFAIVSIWLLSRHPGLRAMLVTLLALVVAGPFLARQIGPSLSLGATAQHELIAMAAFLFNASVTILVSAHVFAGGRVTAHRVRGAILLYLNVAALFAIAYNSLDLLLPGAFASTTGATLASGRAMTAIFSYFSLTTITTTGYGDIVPVHPIARTMANLEAVFGQLFPATLLARLVALHLAHSEEEKR